MAVTKARKRAENYLLERRMFRSLRTGEVIDKRWLRFSFPVFWHYDVLRGLDYLRNAGIKPDSRVGDAIEAVMERRHRNGCWPLNLLHPENIFHWRWRPMSAAQAAGTHCALSEFCVGTTTQRSSCDLVLLALWLESKSCREFAIRSGSRRPMGCLGCLHQMLHMIGCGATPSCAL